jgi:hypothetical protein
MVAQMGQFYSDEVGQYYSGANSFEPARYWNAFLLNRRDRAV